MEQNKRLGLCVIARDEQQNIARCIGSVKGIVDEIVVVDTGSTDDTIRVARSLGAEIYSYAWDDSFSNAKNYALEKARAQWLLLLDADEALETADGDKLLEFINTTKFDGAHLSIRNYTGVYHPDNYLLHSGFRLLRNTGRYRYVGDIHEQITDGVCDRLRERFTTLDITVHHYGYLDDAVSAKKKRQRNIPILERQLEKAPGDAFTLFNLGNEYLSMNEYKRAIEYYRESYRRKSDTRAFTPHLYFRMINCYEGLGQFDQALKYIAEGLTSYPRCTDFEYVRGEIYFRQRRYSLAIDSLEKCLEMGDPPPAFQFFSGCGTHRAALLLGELYRELEDYGRAISWYNKVLSLKPNLYLALYRAGEALTKLCLERDEMHARLYAYFSDAKYVPNVIVACDILINEGLYEHALADLSGLEDLADGQVERRYLEGRAHFYSGRFTEACQRFQDVCAAGEAPGRVLAGICAQSAQYLFAARLALDDPEGAADALTQAANLCGGHQTAALRAMYDVFMGKELCDAGYENEGAAELDAMAEFIRMLLKASLTELLERLMPAFNLIDSKTVLLRLAGVFEQEGYTQQAVETVLRSVRELDTLDAAGARILFRHIT